MSNSIESKKIVNVGVVGMGFMGVTHIKAYRQIPNARLAAICDAVRLPVDGDLSGISGNLGSGDAIKLDMTQVAAYKSLDELLANPEIDLIDLCVPTPAHVKLAIASLKSGKHVICEKPLARTSALAKEIVEAAAQSTGYFMPAMCIRFWPEWAWLKKAIVENTYGRALSARFRRVSSPPVWGREAYFDGARSGGALLDLHIHDTDFVQYCFGRPVSVFSTGFTHYSGSIDHVLTQYQVKSGAMVSAEGSWVMADGFGFNMSYTVCFEKATADYDVSRGADALRLYENGQSPRSVTCEGGDGYIGELSHMIEAILEGRPPTLVTAQDGLSAVEICEAEEKSVNSKQVVTLD